MNTQVFWEHVLCGYPDQCWEWQGSVRCGYGKIRSVNGEHHGAHRVAYCDEHGLDIGDIRGLVVRHSCDNPPCCNPSHLRLGT